MEGSVCLCECVCVVMRGIYWGRSGLPFRKLQIYPSSREARVCVCACACTFIFCVFIRTEFPHEDKVMKESIVQDYDFKFRINWDEVVNWAFASTSNK